MVEGHERNHLSYREQSWIGAFSRDQLPTRARLYNALRGPPPPQGEERAHVTTSGLVLPVWRAIPAMLSAAVMMSASMSGVSAERLPPTGS
jgi:hypothetical protein